MSESVGYPPRAVARIRLRTNKIDSYPISQTRYAVAQLFFLTIAFLTVSLAAYCFVQVPLVKKSTPSAVDFLEKNHIETTRLSEVDKELVAEALRVIRSNDRAVWHAYSNVWQASVFGFLGLGVVSFVLALAAHRQTRSDSA